MAAAANEDVAAEVANALILLELASAINFPLPARAPGGGPAYAEASLELGLIGRDRHSS